MLLAGIGMLLSSSAYAQVPGSVPATGQAGNAARQVQTQAQPIRSRSSARISETAPAPEGTPAGAENIHFKLTDLHLEGVTVYRPAQLQPLFADKINQTVTLADIYRLAQRLTKKYQDDGYLLTVVKVGPQPDTTSGRVVLNAYEGFFSDVTYNFQGFKPSPSLQAQLKAARKAILASKPAHTPEIERALLLLTDRPGVTIQASARPSSVFKAAELQIDVKQKIYDASIQYDNRGTRYLGPDEAIGSLNLNDVVHNGGTLGLRGALSADGEELRFGEVDYTHALGTSGLEYSLQASKTDTRPGYDLEDFDVHGRADLLAGYLRYPIIRTQQQNLKVYGGITSENDMQNALGFELYNDKIRALRLGLDWSLFDDWYGSNSAQLLLSQGIDGLGASKPNDPLTSRFGSRPDFTKLSGTLTREQGFKDSDFTIAAGISAQYSDSPLYAAEQFSLGGENFLSAYDYNERLGDSGAAARLEPRYTYQLPENPIAKSIQGYVFYDTGLVFDRSALGFPSYQHLESTGAGARLFAKKDFTASFEVAKPLASVVATEGDANPRVFFKLSKLF